MISKRTYVERRTGGMEVWLVEKWLLFGVIPLYVKHTLATGV
jgi:hypothetical protein